MKSRGFFLRGPIFIVAQLLLELHEDLGPGNEGETLRNAEERLGVYDVTCKILASGCCVV